MSQVTNVPVVSGAARALATVLGGDDFGQDDLSSGVGGSFGVISIRGSKWRVKYGGEEHLVMDAQGEAAPSLQCVILKANRRISKNYYKGAYVEGSDQNPDCFSQDGERPDPSVQQPVSPSCASCPMNVFGSKITPSGSKVKACADSRRLAVVPAEDFRNEAHGGPLLLRVPAASLQDLATFGNEMKKRGYPYQSLVIRLSFDHDAAFPKIVFRPQRPLTEAEAAQLVQLVQEPEFAQKIEQVIGTVSTVVAPTPPVPVQVAQPAAPVPAPAPVAVAPAPQPVQPPADPFAFVQAQQTQPVAPRPAPVQTDPFAFAQPTAAPAAPPPAAKPRGRPKAQAAPTVAPTPTPVAPVTAAPAAEVKENGDQLDADIENVLAQLDDLDS